MASSNVDIVLANSAAFSHRDVDGMLELWAADAAMLDRRPVGWGEYRGRDALEAYYHGLFDNLASVHEDLSLVSDEGDIVIVSCHTRAQLAGGLGDEMTFDYGMRITMSDGLISSLEIFEDAEAAALRRP